MIDVPGDLDESSVPNFYLCKNNLRVLFTSASLACWNGENCAISHHIC